MNKDENYDYPKTVFVHAYGWTVEQTGPHSFKLIDRSVGYIATFGTKEAAITYMNQEFL